jgi:hypothetical protein
MPAGPRPAGIVAYCPRAAGNGRVRPVTLHETTTAPAAQPVDDASLYRAFNRSVVISGIRCTLTYLVLPYLAPLLGLTGGLGPGLGLVIGIAAITANVFTIRRFWAAQHRWRWVVTAVSTGVIALLVVLMARDIAALLG